MSNDTSGPEYLGHLADQAAANNDSVIADQLRDLSRRWKSEQQQLQGAFDENTRLQARLTKAAKALGEAA